MYFKYSCVNPVMFKIVCNVLGLIWSLDNESIEFGVYEETNYDSNHISAVF